jgi:hypothetical protein
VRLPAPATVPAGAPQIVRVEQGRWHLPIQAKRRSGMRQREKRANLTWLRFGSTQPIGMQPSPDRRGARCTGQSLNFPEPLHRCHPSTTFHRGKPESVTLAHHGFRRLRSRHCSMSPSKRPDGHGPSTWSGFVAHRASAGPLPGLCRVQPAAAIAHDWNVAIEHRLSVHPFRPDVPGSVPRISPTGS